MNQIRTPERETQNRVIALFCDNLGYEYLGNKQDKNNSNIEEQYLIEFLQKRGYPPDIIARAIEKLRRAANQNDLYDANKAVYNLLRYGADIKTKGERTKTVYFIDWQNVENNHFAIAEEVTLRGINARRPDIVLYINGIALAVLELKRSGVAIEEGIRQNISNQQERFNQWFFTTAQFLFAGNDSQGLRYGAIGAQDKDFLPWKEENAAQNNLYKLDNDLTRMCEKTRFIDLIYNFVLFDGGIKKLPRPHQYFAIKAARQKTQKYEGGIIWHTQGSGKSLVMVLLAQWIIENIDDSRILVITDRRELEDQINNVFEQTNNRVESAASGEDLLAKLNQPEISLLSALVHKFNKRGDTQELAQYLKQLAQNPPQIAGNVFVLVDECHRTESGALHRIMKQVLSNAVFVGFTGTPLLQEDKQTSAEVFGAYIHTYQYGEAVADGVVLDLALEARDIEQKLGDPQKIDEWFEAKTIALNNWQKQALQEKWATMRNVLSSRERIDKITMDIIHDFGTKPRLNNDRGTAMLVAGSIYEACAYYRAFAKTELRGRCAVITSYNPHTRDISGEDTGANTETNKQMIYDVYMEMFKDLQVNNNDSVECERIAKQRFIKEPARLRLLIVVDKLLTGFDAPSCTYLYIDKSMKDHGLFQAICRVNRLDGDDKTNGFIVDYKNLFKDIQNAITVYTSKLAENQDGRDDSNIRIQNRLDKCRQRLENARDNMADVLENVEPPKDANKCIVYFCGDVDNPQDLTKQEFKRISLYKAAAGLLRAYANIADDINSAKYDNKEINKIKQEIYQATEARNIVRHAAGEYLDTKSYEADMRHLIDHYIEAEESRIIANFDNLSLIEFIAKNGITECIKKFPQGISQNKEAASATIVNNIRTVIKKEHMLNPTFYDKMSAQLDEIIKLLREKQIDYAEFLRRIEQLANYIKDGADGDSPNNIKTRGQRALYDYLNDKTPNAAELTMQLDEKIKTEKPADWQSGNNIPKQHRIKQIIKAVINDKLDESHITPLFAILQNNKEYQ